VTLRALIVDGEDTRALGAPCGERAVMTDQIRVATTDPNIVAIPTPAAAHD
jgi:hypothetical protein